MPGIPVLSEYSDEQETHLKNTVIKFLTYNKNGMLKCRYVYDAWGHHKVYDENGVELLPASNNIGNINPFRYRSYYWDREFSCFLAFFNGGCRRSIWQRPQSE